MPSFSRGMTLLELILAVTLVGMVGLAFAAIYGSSQRYLVQDMTQVGAQSEAAFALAHMTRNIQPRANRIVRYSDTHLAFRFDPNPLGAATADPADDQWAGYRRDPEILPDRTIQVLKYLPLVTPSADTNGNGQVNGADDPLQGDLEGAGSHEQVAREVPVLEMRLPNSTAASSGETSPPEAPRLTVNVEAVRTVGPETRRSRLQTIIAPRGIPEGI